MERCENILVTIPLEENHAQMLKETGSGCRFRFRNGRYQSLPEL